MGEGRTIAYQNGFALAGQAIALATEILGMYYLDEDGEFLSVTGGARESAAGKKMTLKNDFAHF